MTTERNSPSKGPGSPDVTGFYEKVTGSVQYVVADPTTKAAAIVDPVWDFEPRRGRTDTHSAERILQFVAQRGLKVAWVLDTHPHADHFSAAAYLSEKLGAPQAIGEKVREIAALWRDIYDLPHAFPVAQDFQRLFADGDVFRIGELTARVMLSPGHTLGSITYVVGDDAAFVHDTLMYPDSGTSRADFPGGDASTLYRSIERILSLPASTRLFVGHDYCKDGRPPRWEATVAQQKADNIHVGGEASEAEFVRLRNERDAGLPLPDQMLFALQVNLRGGRLPTPEADGRSYFKVPANRF